MKLLYIQWNSVGRKDLEEAFILEGHDLIPFPVTRETVYGPELEDRLSAILRKEIPDAVFTVDFFPMFSYFCNKYGIQYISWVYDSPHPQLYSTTVLNPCNRIYVFDQEMYREFHHAGISTVRYLPMAANVERLDALGTDESDFQSFSYDVSFVGSLYLEKGNLFDQMEALLPDYTRGYLDALITAQMKVQGYNFIQETLMPVLDDLSNAHPMEQEPSIMESRSHYYAERIINKRITSVERIDLLDVISQRHVVDFFTQYETSKAFSLPNLRVHGPVDYYTHMPLVFRRSRINLNITMRGIHSGIPLRAIDIMAAGGFLLSNFQADFLEHFVPDEDFIYYESREDLVRKVDYYLCHEEERMAIARNGHDKIAAGHTYRHRVREMLTSGGI